MHNNVIYKETSNPKILSGNIFLKDDLILKNETTILEGTVFTMEEGGLIFENKVTAIGQAKTNYL